MSGCHFATTRNDEEEEEEPARWRRMMRTKDEKEKGEKEREKLAGLRDFAGSRNKWKNGRCLSGERRNTAS